MAGEPSANGTHCTALALYRLLQALGFKGRERRGQTLDKPFAAKDPRERVAVIPTRRKV